MAAATEWGPLCERLGASAAHATAWWQRLSALYAGPDRHYHALSHMDALAELWRELRPTFTNPDAVLLAVFFHDAIYEPRAPDNEERSAALLCEFLSHDVRATGAAHVAEWILATKDPRRAVVTDPDLAAFLDMDLAILGAPRATYAQYARNIRREYLHVPEALYRTKRAAILRDFAAAADGTLYRTPALRARFAAAAKENLHWEIDLLESSAPLL